MREDLSGTEAVQRSVENVRIYWIRLEEVYEGDWTDRENRVFGRLREFERLWLDGLEWTGRQEGRDRLAIIIVKKLMLAYA